MDREYSIDDIYLNLFRKLIHKKLGIYISEKRNYLLENKLNKLFKKSKYKDIKKFYKSLQHNNKESFEELIRYITTTHTFFFREESHLDELAHDIKSKKNSYPYILCAACSSGEEVYSIIIKLLQNKISKFLLTAIDINKDVLVALKRGIYSIDRMKYVGKDLLKNYFDKTDDSEMYKIKDYVKKNLIIKKINLVEPFKFEKEFDYIFCRNVMIHFNRKTQIKLLTNILNNLKTEGLLFLGYSESLLDMNLNINRVKKSIYMKI